MTKDNNGINHTDSQEHRSLVDSMAPFLDNGKPKLGIFWYDVANQSLFGVEKSAGWKNCNNPIRTFSEK